jgi:hypothetical protein
VYHVKLEAEWAEPVSLTFHSALRKLNTEPSIGASHQMEILYKDYSFRPYQLTNMAATGKSCLYNVIPYEKISACKIKKSHNLLINQEGQYLFLEIFYNT